MQEKRIDYQYMTGLVEGTRHSPNECFGKVHGGEGCKGKDDLEGDGFDGSTMQRALGFKSQSR